MQSYVCLSDGSVLEVSGKYLKTWKKFGEHAIFIAALVELFPFMVAPLHETMYYSFMNDTAKLQLIERCIAAKMIFNRYGQVPSSFLDDAIMCSKEYIMYEDANGEIDFFCEWMSKPTMRQFQVSDEACATMFSLLKDVKEIVEENIPEQEVSDVPDEILVDNTPEIHPEEAPPTLFQLTEPLCDPYCCEVCDYIRLGPDKPNEALPYEANSYCRVKQAPDKPQSSLFAPAIVRKRLRYGGSSFVKIRQSRFDRIPPPFRWFVDSSDDYWDDYYDGYSD
nr:MAG: hypothetical protein [Aspergillus flavus partitivirus 1]BED98288.1 MAG: hypothetical protein [Aspergillus flavus partitivirus 1]BED98297.1 MAG: hypothetical protein [Aspergillus flavus partitivirus 1]BED98327.1 MAG: hypothetical protein [Aspergillus flavus partitivirus 1]